VVYLPGPMALIKNISGLPSAALSSA